MHLLARLSTLCLVLIAPDLAAAQQEPEPLLSAAEQKALRNKLAELFEADTEYLTTPQGRARDKAQKNYERKKEAFQKEWDTKVERLQKQDKDLLGSMPDLMAIFDGVFTYPRERSLSIRTMKAQDGLPEYALSVPNGYRPDQALRTVHMMVGMEDGEWVDGVEWFQKTWAGSTAEGDTLFHVVTPDNSLDFDPKPDFLTTEGDTLEKQRMAAFFQTLGAVMRTYNLDRNRIFLDAGKENCAFALRIATYFPDRFAGLILRHPTELHEDTRLGSIRGLPVLLVASADTAASAKALKEQLDALTGEDESVCKILEAGDAYPFLGAAAQIEAWMGGIQRSVFKKHIVVEPNHEQFHKNFWVSIEAMDPIHGAPLEKRSRLEVKADREANRIDITAKNIDSVYLMLNDALVDLGKEFTLVINGKAITDKRTRDFNRIMETVRQRFDPNFVFPVGFRVSIPKEEEAGTTTGGDPR